MGIAYLFALLTGFVLAGFVSSLWPLIGQREVSFRLLYPAGALIIVEAFVVLFSIPLLLTKIGAQQLTKGRLGLLACSAFGGAILASFFQGVAVLSIIYQLG